MPARASASVAGRRSPSSVAFPYADQGGGQMGQRREVSRRADRAFGGDAGQQVGLQAGEDLVEDEGTYAGVAARQALDFQRHDQAGDVWRQVRAGAGRVGQDEAALQLGEFVCGDGGLGQKAEAGVHAVGGLAGRHDPRNRGGGGFDSGEAFRI